MSEEIPEVLEQEPQPATPGQLLIQAREAQGLSAADLARQLRLGLRQVEALEQGAFEQLPGRTFVRGFIRNYAKMLGVDPQPILEAYERQFPETAFRPVALPREHIALSQRPSRKWVWYLGGFVALFIVLPLIVYGLLQGGEHLHRSAPLKQTVSIPLPPPVPAGAPTGTGRPSPATPVTPQAAPVTPQAAAPSTVQAAPSVVQQPQVADLTKPAAATAPGMKKIQMKFAGDAWVEIHDRDGKKIFSQLNLAGSEQVVEGKPPFSIVAGNAAEVTVIYNGKIIDLHPYIAVNVARFTLQ